MNEDVTQRGEFDLPLSANISEIQVHHYMIDLHCDLHNQVFHGSTTVFFTHRANIKSKLEQGVCPSSSKNEVCERDSNIAYLDSIDTVREPGVPSIQPINKDERLVHNIGEKEDVGKYYKPQNVSGERKRDINIVSNSSDSDAPPNKLMRNSASSCEDVHVSANLLKNLDAKQTTQDFTLILDCYKLEIQSVSEEKVETSINAESFSSQNWPEEKAHISDTLLQYDLGDQCVKIQVPCHNEDADFRAIKISYKTTQSGHSLKWTKDQDGNDCVYTHGHWINNRSLFPSQDVPEALATWQAYITVPQGLTVIMSGDHNPQYKDSINGLSCYYFWTAFPMPSSTLSLAVGHWTECKKPQIQDNEVIPYRVFSPEVLMTSMADVHRYVPVCMEEVTALLGKYPMKRQDILVVPTSFDSLGMASPSVLYISQSLLHPDLSMFYRLAHEVCHTWFGIVIGPADWTEEWLTEGFCTYLEDIIHTRVLKRLGKISEEEEHVIRDLRDLVKFRTLTAELQNTEGGLQTLLPDCSESGGNKSFVKNGMNPEKKYLQVHYLKGYFLLRYLEKLAGSAKFLECLRKYVQHFHGKLVSSQEVLQFFIQECEEILAAGVTAAELSSAWLEYSGIPSAILSMIEKENHVVSYIKKQVETFCASCKKKKTELSITGELQDYNPDELLLFLELLLDEKDIPWFGLSCLKNKYQIQTCNAEIKHRWCELVIKCKQRHNRFHGDVQDFLVEHQGMGVYLYGELMLSGKKSLINLAHKCFHQLKHSMSTDTYTTVHTMLFGE